jgi:hypothetical protein
MRFMVERRFLRGRAALSWRYFFLRQKLGILFAAWGVFRDNSELRQAAARCCTSALHPPGLFTCRFKV